MTKRIYMPRDHHQIANSRVPMPRAARAFGLTEQQVEQIKWGRLKFAQVWAALYPAGTLVRLNQQMNDEPRSPQAGEVGELQFVTVGSAGPDARVTVHVRWAGGSHLSALLPDDDIELLNPS